MSLVKSATRVLDILELLSRQPDGLSLKEINEGLSIPLSSCHELMRTLNHRGYVAKDSSNHTYGLGMKLFQLVDTHADNVDLFKIADQVLGRMSRVCGETVSLASREGTDVVFMHKKTSSNVIRVVNPVGTRLPAHGSALGKVILAELPPDELDVLYPNEELERSTPHTITCKQEFKKCLTEVREHGVAYDREESNIGVQAVGSLVRDHNGLPAAAISIAVVSVHTRDQHDWHRLEEVVKTGADIISARLGYTKALGNLDLSRIDKAWHGGRGHSGHDHRD